MNLRLFLKSDKKLGRTTDIVMTMMNEEANALMKLGKIFHHSDWVEFGQEMYNMNQKCKVVDKHNDTSVIQTRIARVAEQPRDDDKKKRPLPQ